MKQQRLFILLIITVMLGINAMAQDEKKQLSGTSLFSTQTDTTFKTGKKPDSASIPAAIKIDSVKKHSPRLATRRSAFIPGWGQAYNKQYWKIPIVYGVLAIPTTMFFYNNSFYKKTKFAYEARYKESQGDPSDVPLIDPQLSKLGMASLQSYRNSFRRDRDYSILWFILAWGLQVADATVFAHLKEFNVSDDLAMQVAPSLHPQTGGPGLSFTFNLRNSSSRRTAAR